jgi:hypothetical protein
MRFGGRRCGYCHSEKSLWQQPFPIVFVLLLLSGLGLFGLLAALVP